MRKKAMVLTLDSLFALIATLTLLTAALYYTSQISNVPFGKLSMNRISQDTLVVLEKSGVMRNSLETKSSLQIAELLNSAFPQICSEICLFSTANKVLMNVTKAGCSPSGEPIMSRRVFVLGNSSTYYARIKSWYKK